MNRPAASCPARPADGPDKILMQHGTVAGPTGPTEAAGEASARTAIQSLPPGTCPGGGTVPPSGSSVSVARPGDHRTLAQSARIEFPRSNPMIRPAASCPAGSGDGPDKILMQRGTVACPAGPTEPAGQLSTKTSIHRGTVAPPTGPAGAADAGVSNHSSHSLPPGTCPGGGAGGEPAAAAIAPAAPTATNPGLPLAAQLRQPNPNQDRSNALQPGTVRQAEGPFRRALLSSTVRNTPEAHKLAAQAEYAGGWPVMIAAAEAKQAGLDWRPAATAVRQRLAEDASRHRARHVPRLQPEADPIRTTCPPDAR